MRQYKEITATNYCLQKLKCRCNACSFEFIEYIPLNYELVCFIDEFGEKSFLPTHGEYGYLDLLEKIVEGWKPDKGITKQVVEKFEKKVCGNHAIFLIPISKDKMSRLFKGGHNCNKERNY